MSKPQDLTFRKPSGDRFVAGLSSLTEEEKGIAVPDSAPPEPPPAEAPPLAPPARTDAPPAPPLEAETKLSTYKHKRINYARLKIAAQRLGKTQGELLDEAIEKMLPEWRRQLPPAPEL